MATGQFLRLENVWDDIMNQPYCTAPGVYMPKNIHESNNLRPYSTPTVRSAYDCFRTCFDTFTTSRRGASLYGDPEEGGHRFDIAPRPSEYTSFKSDTASDIVVYPCYKVELTEHYPFHGWKVTVDERKSHDKFSWGDLWTINYHDRVSDYRVYQENNPFCNQDFGGRADQGTGPMCTQWVFQAELNRCSLFSADQRPARIEKYRNKQKTKEIMYTPSNGSFSGYTNCPYMLTNLYVVTASSPGCVTNSRLWGGNPVARTKAKSVLECRNQCKARSDCSVFNVKLATEDCEMMYHDLLWERPSVAVNAFAGIKDCITCPPGSYFLEGACSECEKGYYCPGGGARTICPVGKFCNETNMINPNTCRRGVEFCLEEGLKQPLYACPHYLYGPNCEYQVTCLYGGANRGICHGNDRSGGCSGTEGNGLCTKCSELAAGSICEHKICANSALANTTAIRDSHANRVGDFDFSLYRAEQLMASQAISAGVYGLQVSFRPIAEDIDTHVLTLNSSETTVESSSRPKCATNERARFPFYAKESSVGEIIKVCAYGFFSEATKDLTGGTWGALERSGVPRADTKTCITYTAQFVTRISITISDLFNTALIDGAVVQFKIGDHEFTREAVRGLIEEDIILPGVTAGTVELPITFLQVTPDSAAASDFKLCSTPLLTSGLRCQSVLPFPYEIGKVRHQTSTPHKFSIVDQLAVEVSGAVHFSFNTGICGINNVSVVAVDTNVGAEGIVVSRTSTDRVGSFTLTAPKNSKIRLLFDYNDHDIAPVATSSTSVNIMKSVGLQVSSRITGLEFEDRTTRKITASAAVTLCKYSIGTFRISLQACPMSGGPFIPARTNVGNDLEVVVPAHEYAYDLLFDGYGETDQATIKKGFEYVFPESTRTLDLTTANVDVNFVYHPVPEVEMEVATGAADPRTYAETDCPDQDNPPFDFAVEGNNPIKLRFFFVQHYKGSSEQQCSKMPEGMQLLVRSNLRANEDPCSSTGNGCLHEFEYGVFRLSEKSWSNVTVFAGQPDEAVMWIEHQVNHSSIWAETDRHEINREKILILGNKVISSDSLVSFFSEGQDFVPLLYVYAPPAPHEDSFQSVSMNFEVTTVSQVFENQVYELGGGAAAGLRSEYEGKMCIPFSGCPFKSAEVEAEVSIGVNSVRGQTISFIDDVHTVVESSNMEISTSPGLAGEEGDLVLLMGSSAKFTSSELYYFDECRTQKKPIITWGSSFSSMLLHSRSSIQRALSRLRETIKVNEPVLKDVGATDSQREKAEREVIESKNSIKMFYALLEHWKNDRLQARKHPLDVQTFTTNRLNSPAVNKFVYGASRVSLTRELSMSDSSVLDFQSSTTVLSNIVESEFQALFGTAFVVGPTGSVYKETTKVSESTFSKTREESTTMSVTTSLAEDDTGDELCLEVFQSPHSKTFVFEVCGGETKCPHVEGTDRREDIQISIEQRPNGILQADGSRFTMNVDISQGREDSVDAIIELDAQTALYPVAYNIGSKSLNQPQRFTFSSPVTSAVIFFERLDPSVQQITIGGVVRSACDESIQASFGFEVRWQSSCPAAAWGGDLKNPEDHFKITQAEPNLALTALNPLGREWSVGKDVEVTVSLWARLYEPVGSPWVKVDNQYLRVAREADAASSSFENNQDENGFSTLHISAERDLFRDGERYLFELRSECIRVNRGRRVALGETKSGVRLGVVDMNGPEIVSQTSTTRIKAAVAEFPVAKILFNEPIDCTHPSLGANVYQINPRRGEFIAKRIEGKAVVYCTGNMHQLHVVLKVETKEEMESWSHVKIDVKIHGIRDIYGNLYGETGRYAARGRRLQEAQPIAMNFTSPSIPQGEGFNDSPWFMPSSAEMAAELRHLQERALPTGFTYSSINLADEFVVDSPSPEPGSETNDSNNVIIIAAASGGGAALFALAFSEYRRRKQVQQVRQLKRERNTRLPSLANEEHIQVAKTV